MACLTIVQAGARLGSRDAEDEVAAYLGMAPIAVYEVTTFYNMYNQQPVGKFKINVCTNLPCQLRDGQAALRAHLQRSSASPSAAPRADGQFTVQQSECLGACADAPVMLVNDREMISFMSNDRIDDLLATLARPSERLRNTMVDLSRFKSQGVETAFHGRHINAADHGRPRRQELAPEGLRGARRLPGHSARSWQARAA